MDWLNIVKNVAPRIVKSFKPEAAPYVDLVVKGIEVAEDIKGPSKNKKKLAIDISGMGAMAINLKTGKNTLDPQFAQDVAENTIDTIVKTANEISRKRD